MDLHFPKSHWAYYSPPLAGFTTGSIGVAIGIISLLTAHDVISGTLVFTFGVKLSWGVMGLSCGSGILLTLVLYALLSLKIRQEISSSSLPEETLKQPSTNPPTQKHTEHLFDHLTGVISSPSTEETSKPPATNSSTQELAEPVFDYLPNELIDHIFKDFSIKTLLSVLFTNHRLRGLAQEVFIRRAKMLGHDENNNAYLPAKDYLFNVLIPLSKILTNDFPIKIRDLFESVLTLQSFENKWSKENQRAIAKKNKDFSRELLHFFIKTGVELTWHHRYYDKKKNALDLAIINGDEETVRLILQSKQPLYQALIHSANNPYLLRIILENGGNDNDWLEYPYCNTTTPLCQAIIEGNTESVKLLLEAGADVNAVGSIRKRTPLHVAAEEGKTEIVKLLLGYNVNIDPLDEERLTPFMLAANAEIAKLLLDNGANIHHRTPLGHDAFSFALSKQNVDVIKYLLKINFNPVQWIKNKSLHALISSPTTASEEMLFLLLDAGADINATDALGDTPIMHAESIDVIESLLAKGANANHMNNQGESVLFKLYFLGKECIDLLIKHGADIHHLDHDNNSIVHYAVSSSSLSLRNFSDISPLLTLVGKQAFCKNKSGQDPLQLAATDRQWDILELLIDHPAANIEAENHNGSTLIFRVAKHLGDKNLLFTLLSRANISHKNAKGKTILDVMVKNKTILSSPHSDEWLHKVGRRWGVGLSSYSMVELDKIIHSLKEKGL